VGFCTSGALTRETVTFPFFSQTLVEATRNARKNYAYKMEVIRRLYEEHHKTEEKKEEECDRRKIRLRG
jgi:hypothetical protein